MKTTLAHCKVGHEFCQSEYLSLQDEEGPERGVCEIVASDVQFLGQRREPAPAEDTLGAPVDDHTF